MSEKKESFINVSYCCVNFINVRFKRMYSNKYKMKLYFPSFSKKYFDSLNQFCI